MAKLRAANPENRVLLKTEMGAGHGGPSGRYDAWKDEAFVYAFILDALGLADRRAAALPGGRAGLSPATCHTATSGRGRGRWSTVDVADAWSGPTARPWRRRRRRVNVATNGVCSGGRQDHRDGVDLERHGRRTELHRVVDPVAWTFWTVPADSTPAHTVLPVAAESTSTQHGPVPVMVIWKVV